MRALSAILTFTFLALSVQAQTAPPLANRPNVILVFIDDMGWGDFSCFGNEDAATPNIDRLAGEGVRFEQFYVNSPICSPSRTAFFSGVAPWKSGHYHNALQVNQSQPLDNALSLAGFFKQAGYSTAGYGKITHGWDQKQHWDVKVGHKRDPAPPGAPLTPTGRGEQDWGPIHLPETEMNDSTNADAAIARLRESHDRPFFIAYGTFNPHMPWYVPQKYFELFPLDEVTTPERLPNDLDDVPPLGVKLTSRKSRYVDSLLEHELHKDGVQAYLATTAYADAQIGRVLKALEESPHKDNTIVVFLSDHGFHLGEKNHWQKATLWEEATHCLLMIRAPGVTPDGAVCERFVSLLDIYPTLAELCGLEPPDNLDGRSVVPLLKDPQAAWKSTALTGLTDKGNPEEAYLTIRNQTGRYIRYKKGQEEFYDTTEDPHEWTNQIGNPVYADQIEQLKDALPRLSDIAKPLPAVIRNRKSNK